MRGRSHGGQKQLQLPLILLIYLPPLLFKSLSHMHKYQQVLE